jgi:hypothetical protein
MNKMYLFYGMDESLPKNRAKSKKGKFNEEILYREKINSKVSINGDNDE